MMQKATLNFSSHSQKVSRGTNLVGIEKHGLKHFKLEGGPFDSKRYQAENEIDDDIKTYSNVGCSLESYISHV